MQVNFDPRSLNSHDTVKNVSVPIATDGRNTDKIGAMDSIVQAEFGNQKQTMTTGTYAEEVAKQLDIKEVSSDLDVMDPANFISQCMTGEDAHDLSEEKTPLEEYTASSLERALVRVKAQRDVREESVEDEAKRVREAEKDIREKSEEIALDARLLSMMSQALANSDLPILKDTPEDIKKAVGMAEGVRSFSDASMQYMVKNEDKVTPDSINDSLYGSGEARIGKQMAEDRGEKATEKIAVPDESPADGFEDVKGQIENLLGEKVDQDKLDIARWLYQNDIPVTRENVEQTDAVQKLRDMDTETLLGRIISEMEDGVSATEADLSHLSREEVRDLVDRLVNTDDATVRKAYPEDTVTARRRLEEVRLTMTISAARQMSNLGVTIDINNLEEIVNELRSIEQKAKESLFEETMLTDNDNRDWVYEATTAAKNVLGSPIELLSNTFERRQTITFSELSIEGSTLTETYRKMESTYEAVGTEVRADLGDSIRKAFGNLGSMLDELGMPHTAANERALRILGYNSMEITRESVLQMQTYDNRVNTLMDAMKPQVVKRMVDENINPLELSLDQLEEQVERISEEVGSEDIAFSRFLWKLDRQKAVTEEERESMIGIYRLLDKIEKSDGALVGQLVNEGRDISLKNLLEASRTRKKGHVDAEVSDEAGALARAEIKGVSIDAQIMSAFTKSEMPQLKYALSPKAMAAYMGDVTEMTPEELFELCTEHGESESEMDEYYKEMAADMRHVAEQMDNQTGVFLEEVELPETIGNIMSASDYIRHNMRDARNLWTEEESERVIERFDQDDVDEIYDEIEKTHLKTLEDSKESDDITSDKIKATARMAGHISFYKAIRRYQMYEVPVMTERGVVDVNVTIREDGAERGTVEITTDSDELGRLQGTFKLSGTKVNGFVTAANKESFDVYTELLDRFTKGLEEIGFTMDGNSLFDGERNSLHVGSETTGAKNQDLYRIAKCFLQSI